MTARPAPAAAVAPAAPAAAVAAASPRGGQAGGAGRGVAAASQGAAPSPPAAPAPEELGGVWLAGAGPTPQDARLLEKDRPLSAGEARQLQRLRQAARRWQADLAPLAAAARSEGDAALQADLARLDALLRSLAWAQQLTVAAYAAALRAGSDALALWRTDAAYVDPGELQAWQEADAGASELTTAAETGFVFGVDLGSGQTWIYGEGGKAGEGSGLAPGDAGALAPTADAGEETAGAGGDRDSAPVQAGSPEAGGDMSVDPRPSAMDAAAGVAEALPLDANGGGSPAPTYQLEDLQGGDLPPATEPAGALPPEADSGPVSDGAAPPLAWEEICRPWQPDVRAGGASGACLLSPSA